MKINFKKLILPASLFVAAQSHALGLGNLQINSALDETLKADIPLMLGDGETVEDLSVYLASAEDYKKVGLDKSFVPANIQLEVVDQDSYKHIKLTSVGSVSEPIVSLLLVVDWKNGHLLREYTLLLDPPVFGVTQSQTTTSGTVQTQTYNPTSGFEDDAADEDTSGSSTPSQPIKQSEPTTIDNSSFNKITETVVVESGDTLWRIANRYSDSSINPQQMMVAIFDENPTAFTNNDMNRLKKGARLTIPTTDVASAISFQQAFSEVKSQVEQYKLQNNDYSSNDSDSSSNKDYGIEIVPPRNSDSTNSDSSGSNANSNSESLAELSRTKEELINANLEKQELAERVDDLEKIVKEQEVAMQIKDNNLAQLQQQIGEQSLANTITDPETSEVAVTVTEDTSIDDLSDVDGTQLVNNDETLTDEDDVWDDEIDNQETTDETSDESLVDTYDSEYDDETETSTDEAQNNTDTITLVDATTEEDKPVVPPVQEPAKTMSFMDKAMQYKTEGLIGLGALLAILGFLFFRNRTSSPTNANEGGSFLDSIGKDKKKDEENEIILDEVEDSDEDLSGIIDDVDEAIDSLDDDLDDIPAVSAINDMDDEFDDLDELVQDSDDDLDLESDSTEDSEDFDDVELSSEEAEDVFSKLDDDSETESFDLDLDFDDESDEESDEDEKIENENDDFEIDDSVSVEDFDSELDSLIESTNSGDSNDTIDSGKTELDFSDDDFNNLMNEVDEELNIDDISLDFDTDDADEEKNSAEEYLENDISLDLDLDADNAELDEVAEDSSDLEDLVFDTGEVKIIDEDTINNQQDNDAEIEIDHEEDFDLGIDLDDLVTDDAVDTKIDLARAYFEMGDLDGAMQMVTEIFEEGSEEQQSKAQNLKDEIEKS
jgi:pilus assembly protein FimV